MRENRLQEKYDKYLITLYLLAMKTVNRNIPREMINEVIGLDFDETRQIPALLAKERLVEWPDQHMINITHKGVIEAERIMESTYAQREYSVLRAIYDLGKQRPEVWVMITTLAKAVEMTSQELNPILKDLEDRKHLIGSVDAAVWILPAGIEFLQQVPSKPAPSAHTSYTIIVQGDNSGAIAQGGTNTQTVIQTNNPGFDEAVRSLLELVHSSALESVDKEEIVGEVVALNKLANKDQTADTIERAKLRISILDSLLKAADLATKAAPYLPAIYNYFLPREGGV